MDNKLSDNSPEPPKPASSAAKNADTSAQVGENRKITAKRRLPLRNAPPVPLPPLLRTRIQDVAAKTGKSANSVFVDLVSAAANVPVTFVVVEPQQGEQAGLKLADVNCAMEGAFNALRNSKGQIASHGSVEQREGIDILYRKCVTLWGCSESLAADTFYDLKGLQEGRETYARISGWIINVQRQEEAEKSKGPNADPKLLASFRKRLAEYSGDLATLTRLGFSPEGPYHA